MAFQGRRPLCGPSGTSSDLTRTERDLVNKKPLLSKCFAVVEYRGDWKYHIETWGYTQHWKAPKVCAKCTAARTARAGPLFTDFGRDWPRRSSIEVIANLMGSSPCPFVLIPGFHNDIVRFCSMHTLNLGVLQTLVAEGLLWLRENDVFNGNDLDDRLRCCYIDFKAWARREGVVCSQRRFRASSLHLSDVDFPWMNCKAYNCRCILAWLDDAGLQQQDFGICYMKYQFFPFPELELSIPGLSHVRYHPSPASCSPSCGGSSGTSAAN